MINCHACLAASVLAAALAIVEQRPDFSGEWLLDRAASTLSPGADAMESAVLRIEHAEPVFRVKARFIGPGGKPFEWSYERISDGREIANGENGVSSLRWDGAALVAIDERRPASEFSMSWRYELIDGGRGLRATERLRATTHNQDNVWIFRRLGR